MGTISSDVVMVANDRAIYKFNESYSRYTSICNVNDVIRHDIKYLSGPLRVVSVPSLTRYQKKKIEVLTRSCVNIAPNEKSSSGKYIQRSQTFTCTYDN